MAITLYGIPNCDTVRKARGWLAENGIAHDFHDFRKNGVSRSMLETWLTQIPWETLLNRRGTSWRALPEERRNAVRNADDAIVLMLETPSLIKRPVLQREDAVYCGYTESQYRDLFKL
ncbi:MAG: ArsC family reductase [Burkholderiaceae bacterium]